MLLHYYHSKQWNNGKYACLSNKTLLGKPVITPISTNFLSGNKIVQG